MAALERDIRGEPMISGAQMNLSSDKAAVTSNYLDILLTGDRVAAREVIENAMAAGHEPAELLNSMVWPVMEQIQELYRDDRITLASLNLATRLNRSLADQLTAKLARKEANGK